jgi:hypothetical protein
MPAVDSGSYVLFVCAGYGDLSASNGIPHVLHTHAAAMITHRREHSTARRPQESALQTLALADLATTMGMRWWLITGYDGDDRLWVDPFGP